MEEINRESRDELSVEELESIVKKLDDKVKEYDKHIEESDDASVRKKLRSERKAPKKVINNSEVFPIVNSSIKGIRKFFRSEIVIRKQMKVRLLCG